MSSLSLTQEPMPPNGPGTESHLWSRITRWFRKAFRSTHADGKLARRQSLCAATIAGFVYYVDRSAFENLPVVVGVLIHLVLGVAIFLLSEQFMSWSLFRYRASSPFPLATHWSHFVECFPHLAPDQQLPTQAKLFLLITQHTGPDLELTITFSEYLELLYAATRFARREWSATYLLELNKWGGIALKAEAYFSALKETQLKRRRFLVRPRDELVGIQETHPIVGATKYAGGKLICVPEDLLEKLELKPEDLAALKDFALFDASISESVAIVLAEVLHASNNPDLEIDRVEIIRTSARLAPYKGLIKALNGCAVNYKDEVKIF